MAGDLVPSCISCLSDAGGSGGLSMPRPALDDEDGLAIPDGLPPVVDAHVHLFPDSVFQAVWRWFDAHGWPIRHKLTSPDVLSFLLGRGVSRVVGLTYAHKPGMARALNEHMASLARAEPRLCGLATVFPGEDDQVGILQDAFDAGLKGVKLHCHVQCMSPDDERLGPVYELCERRGLPVVIHAGREPKSDAYRCDPHALCRVDRTEAVLRTFPRLKLCVPHLGVDELQGYADLLRRHDNLWLDTTMVLADYFAIGDVWPFVKARPERVLYGTDFPNVPYAWDREIVRVAEARLPDDLLARLLSGNAAELYGLGDPGA